MKIKIYKSLAMCTLLLGLAACNDFEEMNTDPYAPVYDPEIIGATPDGIDIDYELTPSALKSHGKRHRFGVRQPDLRRTV